MRLSVRSAALAAALFLVPATTALAATSPVQIASDPFSGGLGQHHTVVEPDSFSFGGTIVAAVQAGRIYNGGSDGIAFATSTNNGSTWTGGALPGVTTAAGSGAYDRATDPSVAYDSRHNVWMISTLGLLNTAGDPSGKAVLTSRSTDGGANWNSVVPVAVASRRQDFDKNWIVCDNTQSSPYWGSCYTQFDDFGSGNALKMYYSRDGGLHWTASKVPRVGVIGGQPLVRSNGNVVVPLDNAFSTAVGYTISTNGGGKFGNAFTISGVTAATDPGSIRSGALPTAEIAGDDTIYLAWEDCRFRSGCPAVGTPNDIVYTSSIDGKTWSTIKRVPIDALPNTVDHFLPGIAVDPLSSGASTRIGLVYYYYPLTNCAPSTCSLRVGYVSSADGGAHWSDNATQLGSSMSMSWLPDTSQGRMVGDYMSASFDANGKVHPVYVQASAPNPGGSDCATNSANCNQVLFSDTLDALGGNTPPGTTAVSSADVNNGVSVFKHTK